MEATSGEEAPKRNPLPAALVSNLQSVLAARRPTPPEEVSTAAAASEADEGAPAAEASDSAPTDGAPARPIVLLTSAGGIRSPGLAALVDALVAGGRCDVNVCAPESCVSQSTPAFLIAPYIALEMAKYRLLPLDLLRACRN